ncbi:glycogen/starch/alpha-glucan phosphorylase [Edwardsiella piscicida]|uniref:glycogen/starch/alpha-glucan phosphorylase n=1 Tax=Edwardsiella piscicida TaxID=1263550 RepID=UPI0010A66AF2
MSYSAESESSESRMQRQIVCALRHRVGMEPAAAGQRDWFNALALVVRDRLYDAYCQTRQRHAHQQRKRVYYLSMEFLIGQSLRFNLQNLGLYATAQAALAAEGQALEALFDSEPDAALGNGGLGRLAACFMDSLATLDVAASGHGIKYEYGLFRQLIINDQQIEKPDEWHSAASPWIIQHPSQSMIIPIYGRIEHGFDAQGNYNPMWLEWKVLLGVPNDYYVSGGEDKGVNRLRLYHAAASDSFDILIFNQGDYLQAVGEKIGSENISKILYPSDEILSGKELRLTQEYFLVACTVRDLLRDFFAEHQDIRRLPEWAAVHINDTHPALIVVELMRVLVDEYRIGWDEAWSMTCRTCSFTNHTLMPEALECWSLPLVERLLPRHLQLIYEINHRFLTTVSRRYPDDAAPLLPSLSLIDESGEKRLRMVNLATLGSHKVNGVSAIHSELVRDMLLPQFSRLTPDKFVNQTNGISHRRWLQLANPALAQFFTELIGPAWLDDPHRLAQLSDYCDDAQVVDRVRRIKTDNKLALSNYVYSRYRIALDPMAMFDVHAKRFHEYKRQLLNVLHIIYQYQRLQEGVELATPKIYFFSGKAAPRYTLAKLILQLVNCVARRISQLPRVNGVIRVVFLEDYSVSLAERLIPACDLSEQISMAGTEASGTSNMKFAMNGALLIGTLDGANIEIRQAVGEQNFYLFGHTTLQIAQKKAQGYRPYAVLSQQPSLQMALDALVSGELCADRELFRPLYEMLTASDYYMHLADFDGYRHAHQQAQLDFSRHTEWYRRTLRGMSRMGRFSSDYTIRGYCRDIWNTDV